MRQDVCRQSEPALLPLANSGEGHLSACHFRDTIEREQLSSRDVFPSPAPPGRDTINAPRDQRVRMLEVRGLVKSYPLLKVGVVLAVTLPVDVVPVSTSVGWVLLLVVLQVATQVLLRRPRHRALVFG